MTDDPGAIDPLHVPEQNGSPRAPQERNRMSVIELADDPRPAEAVRHLLRRRTSVPRLFRFHSLRVRATAPFVWRRAHPKCAKPSSAGPLRNVRKDRERSCYESIEDSRLELVC